MHCCRPIATFAHLVCARAQVERLTLDVEWAGHPSLAPADKKVATQAKWKPNPVAMWLPAETPATKVPHSRAHLALLLKIA